MASETPDVTNVLEELLSRRAETRNCEYKAGMPWPKKGKERSGLIKDILALSNSADGGGSFSV